MQDVIRGVIGGGIPTKDRPGRYSIKWEIARQAIYEAAAVDGTGGMLPLK